VTEPIPVTCAVDHGTAKLMPDVDRERAWLLTVDGAPQSYVDLDAPTHLEFEYTRRLGHVLDIVAEHGQSLDVLHLGGGALTLPRYLAATRPGSHQDVVEADRGLLDLVIEHLPLPVGADSVGSGALPPSYTGFRISDRAGVISENGVSCNLRICQRSGK